MKITTLACLASHEREAPPAWYKLVCTAFLIAALAGCYDPPSVRDGQKAELGKRLFFDVALSADRKVSCATCHDPGRHFTQAIPTSAGANGRTGTRNAPSLLDAPHTQAFFWDGRETVLQLVVLQPFTNPVEMGLPNTDALLQRIHEDAGYVSTFVKIFDRPPDTDGISEALTAYLNSLPPTQSRYHRFLNNKAILDEDERSGLALFEGKASCAECHQLNSFTDHLYHHTGVGFDKIAGRIAPMILKLDAVRAQGKPIGEAILSDGDLAELGRFSVTRIPSDLGAFRTPSLRNVAMTAPYMHDGSVATLPKAVEQEIYYRSLARGRPISLTVEEQKQLLAFLRTLTDE